jgi:hypothetical protein
MSDRTAAVSITLAAVHRAIVVLAEDGGGDLVPIAEGLALWLSSAPGTSFDVALQLPAGWRDVARRAWRNSILRDMAVRFFPSLHGRGLALEVFTTVHRYQATGWRRDRSTLRRPDGVLGAAYDVLRLGSAPGQEQIRKILRGIDG